MLHKGTTDGPRHKDLGRGFFWLDTIRSIRIDSSLEIDTIFRYVASAIPPFRYATRSMAYILHTYQHVPVHSTFYMRLSSRLQTLCTYVPMYRTVHYLLHIKYCQTASTLESSLVESLVSSLQSLCSLQSTVRYPIPYSMSYIVDRTSYRLRGVLDTIFATCIVARVQPQYATYRTGKARSVSTIVQPLGQDPYLDTNPSLTTVQSSVF